MAPPQSKKNVSNKIQTKNVITSLTLSITVFFLVINSEIFFQFVEPLDCKMFIHAGFLTDLIPLNATAEARVIED